MMMSQADIQSPAKRSQRLAAKRAECESSQEINEENHAPSIIEKQEEARDISVTDEHINLEEFEEIDVNGTDDKDLEEFTEDMDVDVGQRAVKLENRHSDDEHIDDIRLDQRSRGRQSQGMRKAANHRVKARRDLKPNPRYLMEISKKDKHCSVRRNWRSAGGKTMPSIYFACIGCKILVTAEEKEEHVARGCATIKDVSEVLPADLPPKHNGQFCTECLQFVPSYRKLAEHHCDVHGVDAPVYDILLEDEEEYDIFYDWIQSCGGIQFKQHKSRKTKDTTMTYKYYGCTLVARAHWFRNYSQEERDRFHSRLILSCSAYLRKIPREDGTILVEYCTAHSHGQCIDEQSLYIPKYEHDHTSPPVGRPVDVIQTKHNVPFRELINNIEESYVADSLYGLPMGGADDIMMDDVDIAAGGIDDLAETDIPGMRSRHDMTHEDDINVDDNMLIEDNGEYLQDGTADMPSTSTGRGLPMKKIVGSNKFGSRRISPNKKRLRHLEPHEPLPMADIEQLYEHPLEDVKNSLEIIFEKLSELPVDMISQFVPILRDLALDASDARKRYDDLKSYRVNRGQSGMNGRGVRY